MEIKDRILHHAAALFMRNGIRSVSMDDIASGLAMSKKTLYKWFANKDEIVHAVMGEHLTRTQADCEVLCGKSHSAIDELFQLIGWMRGQFADVHPSIFYDLEKFYPQTWQLWQGHKDQFILTSIRDNLRRGMAEGLYRTDLNVEVLSRLRLAQIELAFNQHVFPPRQFEVQQVQQVTLEHFMLGIASLKGHKLINDLRQVTESE